jgi:hypothetical protein
MDQFKNLALLLAVLAVYVFANEDITTTDLDKESEGEREKRIRK